MARVKRAVNAHKKRRVVLERASGYRGQRSRLYRKAKEQLLHSFNYNFRDRKARKGDFRKLWIQRINAAARQNGITYNRFIQGLHLAGIELDRRALAELAVSDPEAFKAIVEQAETAAKAGGIEAYTDSTRRDKAREALEQASAAVRAANTADDKAREALENANAAVKASEAWVVVARFREADRASLAKGGQPVNLAQLQDQERIAQDLEGLARVACDPASANGLVNLPDVALPAGADAGVPDAR